MRRFYVGLAILAIAALSPVGAHADDRQIAEEIVKCLQEQKDQGTLDDFSIDLQVTEGAVRLKGHVAQDDHEQLAVELVRRVDGVTSVYNELEIRSTTTREPSRKTADEENKVLDRLNNAFQFATLRQSASDATTRDDSRCIAETIIGEMREEMKRGNLRGFGVEVEVDKGIVWLKGRVSSEEQQDLALEIARYVPGVKKVVNSLDVQTADLAPEHLLADTGSSRGRPRLLNSEEPTSSMDDRLAKEVLRRLRKQKEMGNLEGFGLDIHVKNRSVWMTGNVSDKDQLQIALDQARYVPGVKQVVNDIRVDSKLAVPAVANTTQLVDAQLPMAPPVANMAPAPARPMGYPQMPRAFAPARPVNYQTPAGGYPSASPVPMHAPGVGVAPARFDHPQMPGYAWPSYAPHPNYGAVTYPKQYSASTWPYIGPFYPYPQVPLGWRKVTLEWDDGWWFLDFKTRHH